MSGFVVARLGFRVLACVILCSGLEVPDQKPGPTKFSLPKGPGAFEV